MMEKVGLDATKGGWVAVVLVDGHFGGAHIVASAPEALQRWPNAAAYGVDIPIGLVDARREADIAARSALIKRASSVFTAPCASAIVQATYAEADRIQCTLIDVGLSKQSWSLKKRIEDAAHVSHDTRVHEVHPELVFARLAGGTIPRKRSWNGVMARRRLLAAAGVMLMDEVPDGGTAPADDVLDAAAVALAVYDHLHGRSPSYPPSPMQRDANQRVICIRG